MQQDFDKETNRMIPNTLSIEFIAYNKTDRPVTLEFYGLRRNRTDDYSRPGKFHKKVVNPGESIENKFYVSDIMDLLDLRHYTGNLYVCYSEPNGDKHIEKFAWENVVQ